MAAQTMSALDLGLYWMQLTVQLRVLLILMVERMVRIHVMAEMKVGNWAFQRLKEVMKVLQTL